MTTNNWELIERHMARCSYMRLTHQLTKLTSLPLKSTVTKTENINVTDLDTCPSILTWEWTAKIYTCGQLKLKQKTSIAISKWRDNAEFLQTGFVLNICCKTFGKMKAANLKQWCLQERLLNRCTWLMTWLTARCTQTYFPSSMATW